MPYEGGLSDLGNRGRIHHAAAGHPARALDGSRRRQRSPLPPGGRSDIPLPLSRVPVEQEDEYGPGEFGLASWLSKVVKKVQVAVAPPAVKATQQVVQAVATGAPVPTKINLTPAPIQSAVNVAKAAALTFTGGSTTKALTVTTQAASAAAGKPISGAQAQQALLGVTAKQFNLGRSIGQGAQIAAGAALGIGAGVSLLGGGAAAAAAPAAGATAVAAPAAGAGITGITGTVTAATGAASAVGAAVKPIRKALGAKPITARNIIPQAVGAAAPGNPPPAAAPAQTVTAPVQAEPAPITYAAVPSAAAGPTEAGIDSGFPLWLKIGLGLGAGLLALQVAGGGSHRGKH